MAEAQALCFAQSADHRTTLALVALMTEQEDLRLLG